jgi:hypothetical protein
MTIRFVLETSDKTDKKYVAYQEYASRKRIHFGAIGYEDFTTHKDEERKNRYLSRHEKKENWLIDGIMTAGWWSRWILWNKHTVAASIKDAQTRFNIKIIRRRIK